MNGCDGGVSVSGCVPMGGFRARAFRLWLWRALPAILIALMLMLMLILGSYLCSYPGITDSPKRSADLLKDKVNMTEYKMHRCGLSAATFRVCVCSVTLPN